MVSLVLDAVIAVLLLLALGLGYRLHLGLRRLRLDDGEFDRVIGALDTATDRARSALDGLRRTATDTGEQLSGELATAQQLLDDLRFLADRGEQIADRLAQQIECVRSPGARPPPAKRSPTADGTGPVPPPTADLERALRTLR